MNWSGLGNGKSVDDSSESSSIGAESEDEESDDDVVLSEKALGSLASLEETLPIKNKGLSSYYSGKSRSFADLSQLDSITSAKDLWKPENPFNKRRRIRMANRWSSSSRRSSSSVNTLQNSISVPLLPLNEEDNIGDEAEQPKKQTREENPWLKSESCFEISDLDEEQEEENID